jgi:nucleotide-binding universal stress UspA family protein
MFLRLLVPLDGSPEAAMALPVAQPLAEALGAELALARAVPAWAAASEGDLADAEAYLQHVSDGLRARGLAVRTVVPHADASPTIERELRRLVGESILGQARANDADLIVMATRGRAGTERVVFGRVAEHLLAFSRVPVLLLRTDAHTPSQIRRVIVPVDGTPGGALALAGVVGLAKHLPLELALLCVVLPTSMDPFAPIPGMRLRPYVDPAWDEAAQRGAQTYVDGLARRLAEQGLVAQAQVVVGAVAQSIVRGADEFNADLIAMSTHAHIGPARAALGSVADVVVRSSGRPVLLFRRGAAVGE